MFKKICSVLTAASLLAAAAAGCSQTDFENKLLRPSPTPSPVVTQAPDLVNAEKGPVEVAAAQEAATPTPTPVPTSTPAVRMIGTKTSQSKYIFLTNSLSNSIREIYLTLYGDADWGKNLVAPETTIRSGERVQMFFDEPASPDDLYNMKIVDREGSIWAIYAFQLSDMDEASIQLIGSVAFLFYTSLATGKQTNTMYGERLAKSFDYSSYVEPGPDEHEGDYNYGYYDTDGRWVTYEEGDTSYSEYGTDGTNTGTGGGNASGTETGSEDSEPIITYYDEDQYEGNPAYGYYDEYGNWTSYY